MQDSAQPGALQDSEARNFEELEALDLQAPDNDRAGETDANQDDEDEAGAPLPSSVDSNTVKTEYAVLTEQIVQQNALIQLMMANQQQGAATSVPRSNGSMATLNAEIDAQGNQQQGSNATTDPMAGTNQAPQGSAMPQHRPFPLFVNHQSYPPYAPHQPVYNPFGPHGFPYQQGFPPPVPPGFQYMGHQNMVPRDDPYDINSPLICRQATRVTKVYTERMLQAGTVSVGLLLVWIRSFSAFCKTLIVRNPVQLAIMHLRPPADSWAEQFVLPDGRPLISASWNEFTGALLHAPFTDSVEYYYTTTQVFCDLKQANLKVSEYVRQANDIFLGRETHPFLSQLTEGHFSFKFFMGLHPQIRLNIRLSPEALMNKAFTDLTSQAQEVGTHVESLDTRAPHQVAQMGRSGPRPSSQQRVTATPPVSLPANYWQMPVVQRKDFEKGLKQPGDKAWRKQIRRNEGRCVFCGDDRHVYEDCRLAPKVTVALLDVDAESKNGKQAEE